MHMYLKVMYVCENVSQLCKEQKNRVYRLKKDRAKLGKKNTLLIKFCFISRERRLVNQQFWQYDPIHYLKYPKKKRNEYRREESRKQQTVEIG